MDLLTEREFNAGFGSHTPMFTGQVSGCVLRKCCLVDRSVQRLQGGKRSACDKPVDRNAMQLFYCFTKGVNQCGQPNVLAPATPWSRGRREVGSSCYLSKGGCWPYLNSRTMAPIAGSCCPQNPSALPVCCFAVQVCALLHGFRPACTIACLDQALASSMCFHCRPSVCATTWRWANPLPAPAALKPQGFSP